MSMTAAELAGRIGAKVSGDGATRIEGCAGLEEAGPHQVSFLANSRYAKLLASTKAGAVIVSEADADQGGGRTLLIANDPYFAFRQAMVALHGFRKHPQAGVSSQAIVASSAKVGRDCTIGPFAMIEADVQLGDRCVIYPYCYVGAGSRLGDECVLFPSVTIYDGCVLGNRVTLHAGCVIGQDGFGYATHHGAHHKIPQIGNVVIEDDVEMGACCTIDRATVGSTRVGKGSKFSDLVAIGHGAEIGEHNLLVAQVGIAGSTRTGKYVVMGGQTGVAGHLKIGDMVQLAAKSGVMTDLTEKGQYGGSPAQPLNDAKRVALQTQRLPDLAARIKKLERELEALKKKLETELKAE